MDPLPHLAKIEADENVAVLLAVESGSRAWGFPSPDSDWDVRFIYARPTLWHLQVDTGRDVIERQLPDDLDLSGWDVRKTLGLVLRGNCTIREWLCSPIVYRSEEDLVGQIRQIGDLVNARHAAIYHYLSLIERVRSQWLQRSPVNLKKYLYAVRPALVLRWLRTHREGTPPMDIPRLMAEVDINRDELRDLDELLCLKALASEIGSGPAMPAIDAMIEREVSLGTVAALQEPRVTPSHAVIDMANKTLATAAAFVDQRQR